MIRLFETHKIRNSSSLEGLWDFQPVNPASPAPADPTGSTPTAPQTGTVESPAPSASVPSPDPAGPWISMPVPGCWEQHPDYRAFRGQAWYRRRVQTANPGPVRLEFKGASHTARVFWDGRELGSHYNAYTPFSFLIPHTPAGDHEILVLVDNRFVPESTLHIENDYYTYGGLMRGVILEEPRPALLERIEFQPFTSPDGWKARIRVYARLVSETGSQDTHASLASPARLQKTVNPPATASFRLTLSLLPKSGSVPLSNFAPVEIKLPALITTSPTPSNPTDQADQADQAIHDSPDLPVWEGTLDFPGVEAWSGENPCLYRLQAVLTAPTGLAMDDLIERVGFREIAARDGKILLNGTPVMLKGFNRHEDMGLLGASIPLQFMLHDLDLMRDLGCNTVRTSHYPNDELFLDLCDELGFLVWEENHARGLGIDQMKKPGFEDQCRDCNREMVQNHYNHPSVIIWGLLNECASWHEEGRVMYARQYAQIRALDKSRPLTHATCHHGNDLCLDLCDIVSMNVYSGWYNDNPVEKTWLEIKAYSDSHGGQGKPVIISEFGAAGLYGWRDPARQKWSEERQADVIDEAIRVYSRRPEIQGLLIWQFADCRVTEGAFYARPRCHNNKGVVDDWRRPKMAYTTVKEAFRNLIARPRHDPSENP